MEAYHQKPRISQRIPLEGKPTICSLQDLQVQISQTIRDHLALQYQDDNDNDTSSKDTDTPTPLDRVGCILQAMKTPPSSTVCRVNLILGTRLEIQTELEEELRQRNLDTLFSVQPDDQFHDVLLVQYKDKSNTATGRIDQMGPPCDPQAPVVFPTWPERQILGWPLHHRAVMVDRLAGEAVLRGSHIFVKGIMCADKGIQPGESVAVYADVRSTIPKNRRLKRGAFLEQYRNRLCVYLGLGVSLLPRIDFFRLEQGIGIQMVLTPQARVGPMLPPISGILPHKLYFQNLPSLLVAHALEAHPGHVIIDMCAAPGGKTSHVASLVRNEATIVACDKSRKKMITAQTMFREMGATNVTALALNTTACVLKDSDRDTGWRTVKEILDSSERADDGLLHVSGFYPESFDRVLLDPPCSALGLRPKLQIVHTTLADLQDVCLYQRKFIGQAVLLLKPGGIMTYSTCTFHADENERMVAYMLKEYQQLELVPVLVHESLQVGQPGLPGLGLNDMERGHVRRFDPWTKDEESDTIGFFVAKFRKRLASETKPR